MEITEGRGCGGERWNAAGICLRMECGGERWNAAGICLLVVSGWIEPMILNTLTVDILNINQEC